MSAFKAANGGKAISAEGGFTAGMTHGDPAKGGRHGDEGLKIGRQGLQPIYDFLEANKGKPFFLWYAPMLPHQPHNPPERLLAKYRDKTDSLFVAKYWAMCEWWDETCGELLGLSRQARSDRQYAGRLCDRQRLDSEPDGRNSFAAEQAFALRRRHSHADHAPLAGQT